MEINELIEELNQEEGQQYQPFTVKSLEDAVEASRRISYFRDRQNEIDTIVHKQLEPFLKKMERIKEWGEQAKKEFLDKEEHYQILLEAYLRNEIEYQMSLGKKPKKTIKLPYGEIKLKKQQPEFKRNENQLLEYARSNGYIKVSESADWSAIKDNCQIVNGVLIDQNGEIVAGVEVVERPDKFVLKMEE